MSKLIGRAGTMPPKLLISSDDSARKSKISAPILIDADVLRRNDLRDIPQSHQQTPKKIRVDSLWPADDSMAKGWAREQPSTKLSYDAAGTGSNRDALRFPSPWGGRIAYDSNSPARGGLMESPSPISPRTMVPLLPKPLQPLPRTFQNVTLPEPGHFVEQPHQWRKPRSRRWKSLGNIFSRSGSSPTDNRKQDEPFPNPPNDAHKINQHRHGVQKQRAGTTGLMTIESTISLPSTAHPHSSIPKRKPVTRTPTAPTLDLGNSSTPRLQLSKPLPPILPKEEPTPINNATTISNGKRNIHQDGNLLLNVSIPKSDMERYSIMFDGIMKSNKRTSLLARRQTSLKPLRESWKEESWKMKELPKIQTSVRCRKSARYLVPADSKQASAQIYS